MAPRMEHPLELWRDFSTVDWSVRRSAILLVVKKDSTVAELVAVAKIAAWVGEWVDEMVVRQAGKMDTLLAAATVQKWVAPMVGELVPAQVESWDSLMGDLVALCWAASWAGRRATC